MQQHRPCVFESQAHVKHATVQIYGGVFGGVPVDSVDGLILPLIVYVRHLGICGLQYLPIEFGKQETFPVRASVCVTVGAVVVSLEFRVHVVEQGRLLNCDIVAFEAQHLQVKAEIVVKGHLVDAEQHFFHLLPNFHAALPLSKRQARFV